MRKRRRKLLLALFCAGGIAGSLFGIEPLRFDGTQWHLSKRKQPGSETVKLETAPLGDAGRTVPAVAWGTPHPGAIELSLQSGLQTFEPFERAEFVLTVHAPEALPLRRIVLRLADSSGEVFQLPPDRAGGLTPGKNELRYTFDPASPKDSIWGGNGNKKVDWPLRVAGIAIDLTGKTPVSQRILLDSLDFRPIGEYAEVSLRTGHPLNLLLPERKAPPELAIGNAGRKVLELSGSLSISDGNGDVRTEPVSCRVAPGREALLPLSGDYTRQGYWKVEYHLKSASGREFSGTHRFARMNPAGPTPGRAEEFLFGLCGHPERFTPEEGELEALAAGLCGAKILRMDFSMGRIEPSRDRWNFSVHDRLVDAFGRHGVEIQCMIGYATSWAVAADYKPKKPQRKGGALPDYDAFGRFAGVVAEHYKDRIRYFEIWNEPDIPIFANFSEESYMELLRRAYRAVKKAAPESKVMSGGLSNIVNRKLLDLLRKDGGEHFDLFAFHGHCPFSPYVDRLGKLREDGLIGSGAPRPWYANETALTSAIVGERRQSHALVKKLLYAWASGAMGYNWYLLREKNYYPLGHFERHYGLITAEFEPKPAYVTYNMLARTYKGSQFLRMVDLAPGVYALLFRNPEGQGLLALWNESAERTVLLTGLPAGTSRIDLFGNEEPLPMRDGAACLRLSEEPFTLRMPQPPAGALRIAGDLIGRVPQQLALPPGGNGEVTLNFTNPLPQPLNLAVRTTSPEKLFATPAEQTVTLPAKGNTAVKLRLTAERGFQVTSAVPALFRFSVALSGLPGETFTLPVVNQLPEGQPLFRLAEGTRYYPLVPSVPGNEPFYWKGVEDLSADVFLSRQGNCLLLRAEVRDDVHVQPYRGTRAHNGDSIQFRLRLPGQEQSWKFGLTRLANGKPEVYCWHAPDAFKAVAAAAAIRLETSRDEGKKTTVYRAEIPFHAIGLTPAIASGGFRFNLIVNDNDGKRREGFLFAAPDFDSRFDDDAVWSIVNLP